MDFSYVELECPICSETRSFINIHTLNLAVTLTKATLRSVTGGGYHHRVTHLMICPICDAYALMQEWTWSVPYYSNLNDCLTTVHDNDVSDQLLSFGDVEFTPSAFAGALEIHRHYELTRRSSENLNSVAGLISKDAWNLELRRLREIWSSPCSIEEMDGAIRILLCQKPASLPWKIYDKDHEFVSQLATHASRALSLDDIRLPPEYEYSSLSLCVIDAVYSIGVKYIDVQGVVHRYCQFFDIPKHRPDASVLPALESQDSLHDLCARISELGTERMANEVFGNRQRTSTRNGILKADAIARFAHELIAHGINHFQDIRWPPPAKLEAAIKKIPGQRSGISLQYFWMLAGSNDLIKPDRMVLRFLKEVLQRDVAVDEATTLLTKVARELRAQHPQLTPRALDYAIWSYQRSLTTPDIERTI